MILSTRQSKNPELTNIVFFKQTKYRLLLNTSSSFAQVTNAEEVRRLLDSDPTLVMNREIDRILQKQHGEIKKHRVNNNEVDQGAI